MILRVRDDEGNVFDIPAIRGLSSYEIAVKHGFEGTEEEWLESIGVEKGDSAYQVWLDAGNEGDVAAFLAAIKGDQGIPGPMPNISIKDVTTVDSASQADVILDITDPANPTLSFAIPRGEKGDPGKQGPSGTSVTITNITESSADGGSNVVTFSNGQTLTVKNGSKGSTGSSSSNLPSVSSSDNGKFLRVVSGSWSAVSISSAEEASF